MSNQLVRVAPYEGHLYGDPIIEVRGANGHVVEIYLAPKGGGLDVYVWETAGDTWRSDPHWCSKAAWCPLSATAARVLSSAMASLLERSKE